MLSVTMVFVMSATERPTDQDRWPRFFMRSNALNGKNKNMNNDKTLIKAMP